MSEAWKRNLSVPFFSQRENTYVWHQIPTQDLTDIDTGEILHEKGKKIEPGVSMAYCSCNITSLCMILHYFGITKDSPDDMMQKVFSSDDGTFKKWHTEENGPDKLEDCSNMKYIAQKIYGVSADIIKVYYGSVMTLDLSKKYIAAGYPVWFSYGALNKRRQFYA
jgi:hypothetical protein